MDAPTLARTAAAQHGLFTRCQARRCGYSAYQIRHRLARAEWTVVLGPVLARAGTPVTARLRDLAAALAVPGSVLAGPSAARLHGMPVPDGPPCLSVARHDRPHLRTVRLLRDPIDRHDIQPVDGWLVTSRPRAVFDCVRLLPDATAIDLLDRALQQRWITLDDFASRVRAFSGRHGAGRMAAMARIAGSGAHSAAERMAVTLLRRADLRGWRANVELHDADGFLIGVGDLVFRAERLVVEVDGRAHHVTPDRFERDRDRQNRLVAAGWTVLRFTWRDLTTRPDEVVRTIRHMIALSHRTAPRTLRH